MSTGTFVFVLHSHLPYYRKAGMWPFGEENLYECICETYLPLLNSINKLKDEGIQAKLTIGITPILCEQLNDEHLIEGFLKYLEERIKAAQEDIQRYPDNSIAHSHHLQYLATFYLKYFESLKNDFIHKYNKNLLAAYKQLQDEGCIEIITSSATHCFSPLLATDATLNAQFKVGVETYKKYFGRDPKGAWLPECAYRQAQIVENIETGEKTRRPSIGEILENNHLKYFFTDYHAIEGGVSTDLRKTLGIYGDIKYIPLPKRESLGHTTNEAYWLKEADVAVMSRNNRASFQVWSAADGYPGDGSYREFHKKDSNSGLHYWRITSKETDLGDKMFYDPLLAQSLMNENADHYVGLISNVINNITATGVEDPLILVAFDTELYGHWWFEGIEWLEQVIRKMHTYIDNVNRKTASEYLQDHPPSSAITLPESSWGEGGHFWVWNNDNTNWVWPILHQCEREIESLAYQYSDTTVDSLMERTLNQLAREMLLMESSDWPFLITTFQARDYATERFNDHVERFKTLLGMIKSNNINEPILKSIEDIDNPFSNIDFRIFKSELVKKYTTLNPTSA